MLQETLGATDLSNNPLANRLLVSDTIQTSLLVSATIQTSLLVSAMRLSDLLDPMDLRVRQGLQGHQGHLVSMDLRVRQDLLVPMDLRVPLGLFLALDRRRLFRSLDLVELALRHCQDLRQNAGSRHQLGRRAFPVA
jgi:hypothetical protein